MQGVQLDHVFVFVKLGAPERTKLEEAGLRESYRRRHPGQGTTNVCFCFDNAYLELLWEDDREEITSPVVTRTHLAERSQWRQTGASPFGIALRTRSPEDPLPLETWDYRAPFLPEGMTIPMALASDDPQQPLLFRSPSSRRPDEWTDGKAGARQRSAGLAEIMDLHLDLPRGLRPAPELLRLQQAGILSLGERDAGQRMILTLSRTESGSPRRLSLPDFTWTDESL